MSGKFRPVAGCAVLFLLPLVLVQAAADSPAAGRPKQFGAGKAAAYAVWEEKGVWHLRVTSKDDKNKKQKQEDRVVFSGRVVVEGDKVIGKFEKLEKTKAAGDADWVFAHRDGQGFDFQFANFGLIDGIDFKTGPAATAVKFRLLINGVVADPKRVLIGRKGSHPEQAEFALPANQP